MKTMILIMSKWSQFEKFLIVAVKKWRRVVIEDDSEVRKGHHSLLKSYTPHQIISMISSNKDIWAVVLASIGAS